MLLSEIHIISDFAILYPNFMYFNQGSQYHTNQKRNLLEYVNNSSEYSEQEKDLGRLTTSGSRSTKMTKCKLLNLKPK